MIQINLDVNDLIKMGLSQEEIFGYIEFFADDLVNQLPDTGDNNEN